MPLLRNVHLGDTLHLRHPTLPLQVSVGPLLRFRILQIILLAIEQQHHVGVLLERTGITQIAKQRALVIALVHFTGHLGERHNGDLQFLRERLERGGDVGQFLYTVVLTTPLLRSAADQLHIVDDEEMQAPLLVQGSSAQFDLADGQLAGCIDVDRKLVQILLEVDQPSISLSDRALRLMRQDGMPDASEITRCHS